MFTNQGLVPVEPRALFRRVLRDFDRLFEDRGLTFAPVPRGVNEFAWIPDLEVFERDHRLMVRIDLPGMKKEEVSVTVAEDGLTITGERKHETEERNNEWLRTERTYGKFIRTIPLPDNVKLADIKGTFEGGVLEITVPLPSEAAVPPYKVEIATDVKKEAKPAA